MDGWRPSPGSSVKNSNPRHCDRTGPGRGVAKPPLSQVPKVTDTSLFTVALTRRAPRASHSVHRSGLALFVGDDQPITTDIGRSDNKEKVPVTDKHAHHLPSFQCRRTQADAACSQVVRRVALHRSSRKHGMRVQVVAALPAAGMEGIVTSSGPVVRSQAFHLGALTPNRA
jgi:hypothetical protein